MFGSRRKIEALTLALAGARTRAARSDKERVRVQDENAALKRQVQHMRARAASAQEILALLRRR